MTSNVSFAIQPSLPQSVPTDYDLLPYAPESSSPLDTSTTPSLPDSDPKSITYASAIIAPLGLYLPYIHLHSQALLENMIRGFLLPKHHEDKNLQLSPEHVEKFKNEVADVFKIRPEEAVRDISNDIIILVCGHQQRDERCGILGPVVADALTDALNKEGYTTTGNKNSQVFQGSGIDGRAGERNASVGLISHIGGHKFAGNVIIYLPAHHSLSKKVNAEQEKGDDVDEKKGISVWYGRVKPEHADGIIQQTIKDGIVVKELLRGIVDANGDVVTLPE